MSMMFACANACLKRKSTHILSAHILIDLFVNNCVCLLTINSL